MKKLWWNDYIGIPYESMGCSKEGCDCWGLVRLVYREEFGIDIPEVTADMTDYATHDEIGLIPMGLDALWDKTDNPQMGDVVSFNILGHEQHVGVVTAPGYMLHTFNKSQTSCIESYSSRKWKNRIVGFYHYSHAEQMIPAASGGISIIGKPHPLKPRIASVVLAGQSLEQIINNLCDKMNVPVSMRQYGAACVNLKYIPRDQWATTFPANGDAVVFRIHGVSGGGNPFKAILGIVLVVAAAALTWWAGGTGAAAVGGFLGVSSTVAGVGMAVVSLGLTMAGMALLNNSIASRPLPEGVGGFVDGKFLAGGNNTNRIYETLPQVLGIGRMTFDYLGKSYTEQADPYTNYLRAIFTAGYGPVEIGDIRNGDTPISKYNDVQLNVYNGFGGDQTPKLYTSDPDEQSVGVTLGKNSHNYRTTVPDVDQIQVVLYWPQGLWYRNDRGDKGDITSTGYIRFRAVGGEWADIQNTIRGAQFTLPVCLPVTYSEIVYNETPNGEWSSRYLTDKHLYTKQETIPVYQWHTFTIQSSTGNIRKYTGAITDTPYRDASYEFRRKVAGNRVAQDRGELQIIQNPVPNAEPHLAPVPNGEKLIAYVCVKGEMIYEIQDKRNTNIIQGCEFDSTGRTFIVAPGTINNMGSTTWRITKRDEMRAFTRVYTFNVPRGQYEVDVQLTSADDKEKANWSGNAALQVQWLALRTFTFRTPFTPRKPLAWMEMRIRATDQLSGRLEEINGYVGSIVLDYDYQTDTWVKRVSNNPASLFRHVLQGPAMADEYRVDDAHIDLEKLKDWHNYCRIQGFTFFKIVGADSGLSVYELLVQIAAAGYAKPLLKPDEGGIWTVWVDEPQTTVLQHFTEHNTWGVQWTKRNVEIPHAIRATFVNKDKWFERDTVTIYVDGYNEQTATKYENWGTEYFEGVTDIKNVQRICRRSLAYAKLRPENLSFMCAMEYLTSQPGDLVRVTNSFVQWGLGSGWITELLLNDNGAAIGVCLSETVTLSAGNAYSIRIRQAAVKGTSFKADIAIPTESIQTNKLYFSMPHILRSSIPTPDPTPHPEELPEQNAQLDASEPSTPPTDIVPETKPEQPKEVVVDSFPEAGDLYQFGFVNKESHECLIESVVPESGDIARITVCDYSPELYDIDDGPLPEYDAGISRPEKLPAVVIARPVFVRAVSDEQVIIVGPDGSLTPRLAIVWERPQNCQSSVTAIQFRYRLSTNGAPASTPSDPNVSDGSTAEPGSWTVFDSMPLENTTMMIAPVEELYKYDVDARFLTNTGMIGPWTIMVRDYAIIGKTALPPTVQNFRATIHSPVGILLEWDKLNIVDIAKYRIGGAVSAETTNPELMTQVANRVGEITFTLVGVDTGGRTSEVPATASVMVMQPKAATGFQFDTRTDGLYLTWDDCDTTWPVQHYMIKDLYANKQSKELRTQTVISPRAVGVYKIKIQATDIFGNMGDVATHDLQIMQPSTPQPSITIDNGTVRISWLPVQSSFPIRTYQVYSVDGQLLQETNSTFYDINGPAGMVEYRIRAVDTAGNVSAFAEATLQLTAPEAPQVIVSRNKTRDGLDITWTPSQGMLPVISYDIVCQWGDANERDYGSVDGTTMLSVAPLPVGTYMFMVRAVDASGNHSIWGTSEITILPPGKAIMTDVAVIDNNVQVFWNEPVDQFFAIAYYNFGVVEDGYFMLIGRIDARFASRFERQAGVFTYRVCPVDVAGNVGKCSDITARVAQPPDFIFFDEKDSTFNGEKTNAVLDGQGGMILPVYPNETWQDSIDRMIEVVKTDPDSVTWQLKVDNNYPMWMSPPAAHAKYVEIVDIGTLVPATKITVTPTISVLEGNPTLTCDIDVSNDQVEWRRMADNAFETYAAAFQYVRYTFNVTGGMMAITDLRYTLDVKKQSNFGTIKSLASDNGEGYVSKEETPMLYGTWVPFTISFTDVQSGPMAVCNEQGKTAYISFEDVLNPKGFRVYVLDKDGNRVDGTVSWSAFGV